jgi:hypothetical protein
MIPVVGVSKPDFTNSDLFLFSVHSAYYSFKFMLFRS